VPDSFIRLAFLNHTPLQEVEQWITKKGNQLGLKYTSHRQRMVLTFGTCLSKSLMAAENSNFQLKGKVLYPLKSVFFCLSFSYFTLSGFRAEVSDKCPLLCYLRKEVRFVWFMYVQSLLLLTAVCSKLEGHLGYFEFFIEFLEISFEIFESWIL